MKTLLICLALIASSHPIHWQPDFQTAERIAREKHQCILLNFSGSDWCIPCIKMERELFSDSAFSAMSDTSLVLVNADFPRKKKNELTATKSAQNDSLAARYNPEGHFPFTILLDETGKVIRTWDGLPKQTAAEFTRTVKQICDETKH